MSDCYDKETLRKLQMVEFEILKEIKRICDKNGLRYYLIGGTLLGSVRHMGFIPWDDDLDIAMPRKDYEEFSKLCSSQLDEKYYLHNIETDNKYWLPFAKIRKKNTVFDEKSISHLNVKKGIFVDIFPLDFSIGETDKGQTRRTFAIKQLSSIIQYKAKIFKTKTFVARLKCFLAFPFSIKKLTKKQLHLMKKLDTGTHFVNYGSNYSTKKQTMPIEYYEPHKMMAFEGEMFSVPNKYDKVLTRIYGEDFMRLPPMEKRITHKPVRIWFGD